MAFLRAVNVGRRRVKMATAVTVLETLGFRDVWSYMRGLSSATTVSNRKWKAVGDLTTSRNTTMLRKLLAKIDDR